MASAKRKDRPASAKTKEAKEDGSNKRRKVDAPQKQNRSPLSERNGKPFAATSKHQKLPTISTLVNEQPAFPRGGGDILTPLEKKQIRAQADRDVLIEQKRKQNKDLFDEHDGDDLAPDLQDGADVGIGEDRAKSKSKKSSKRRKVQDAETDAKPRIEGLNYKRITSGSLILGRITKVNQRDLAVSLPNNLTGYVPLTDVSAKLTEKVESMLNKEAEGVSGNEDLADEEDEVNLSQYFRPGQWIRAAVTSTAGEADHGATKAKKRIGLSLDPALTNVGLTRKDLVVNCTIQASVVSIEDHGMVVDIGLSDAETKGFLPSTELPPSLEPSQMKTGMVLLCRVPSPATSGRIVKLSAKLDNGEKKSNSQVLSTAPSVNSFLPGTLVEILLSDVSSTGLAGKVMGLVDVTCDIVHSGARSSSSSLEKTHKPGQKVVGRLLNTFPLSDTKKLGFSVLNHVIAADTKAPSGQETADNHALPVSSIIDQAEVVRVDPGLGVYFKVGPNSLDGFVHISRLNDKKIDAPSADSGPYKVSTAHRARVLDYNAVDDLYILSLQETVIAQPFLRVEDVVVGEVVKGTVEKHITDENGLKGLIVNLSEGVTGFVPRLHLSDTTLQHPEKKFREGTKVSARVLSTDIVQKQVRLTLKKSLVNSDLKPWSEYKQIKDGESSLGTLVKVQSNGAVVQFYGSVRAFLPAAEMSEAYIKDATQHFRTGQVLNVNCLHVDAEQSKMTVSCRDPSLTASNEALQDVYPGTVVAGTVFEKSEDDLMLRLADSNIIARLEIDHISDGSLRKRQAALNKTRVGQLLTGLLVLEVQANRRLLRLCNRASLLKASKDGTLLCRFDDVREGKKVTGFVSNIVPEGIFISFAAGLTGFMPKSQMPTESLHLPDLGFTRLDIVTATISSIDYKSSKPRFWLTTKEVIGKTPKKNGEGDKPGILMDPVDGTTTSLDELNVGAVTKARITSVKDTQLNVELAKNVLGRIDVSELFDKWEDIKDRKKPVRLFAPKQVLPVRILGAHDARNHRFLPISHRAGKTPLFELSGKPSYVKSSNPEILTLEKVQVGSSWLAFVNNIAEDCLWVNISPNVRGRIRAIDVSDDLSLVANLEENFPVGSALKAKVIAVNVDKNQLDLSAKAGGESSQLALKELSEGMILPGRVTKTSERQVLVQLSDNIVGAVNLIDLADDYAKADPTTFHKNEIVRVCVVDIDNPNKKILLSLRPSKILSSSLPVEDREITSIQQLQVNDIVRGFICNVADHGLYVTLGHGVTAFVRISNLSDSYLKEWKDAYQRDQLVRGRIISLDADTGHVQMSLKESVLKADYITPMAFSDLKVGQVVTGKVAKVEEFGVFIVVDNSDNLRGLCHRSEIAEQRVEDARKLISEGDAVKAKVLKLDPETRRISFGLKASYFSNDADGDDEADISSSEDGDIVPGGVELGHDPEEDEDSDTSAEVDDDGETEDEESEDNEDILDLQRQDGQLESLSTSDDDESRTESKAKPSLLAGLQVGGFDWQGLSAQPISKSTSKPVSDTEEYPSKHKKKRKPTIHTDLTGNLDTYGPQSSDDYERLLLSESDSSLLWLQYMAFHLSLGEVDTARHIAQRALKTITPIGGHSESEKLNIWIALLNLENAYGDPTTLETTFTQACQFNDPQSIHQRLASIYIQSSKYAQADQLFQTMLKKFGSSDPKLWPNYANFLFDTLAEPERARSLLPRALQTLPASTHVDVTAKFAAMEFRSPNGLAERGRTIFEGLLDSFPKRVDLWNVLLDLEIKHGGGEMEGDKDRKARVRRLFERIFDDGGQAGVVRLKNKQAKFFFKRWLEFEEGKGDERALEAVKKRAEGWVRKSKNQNDQERE